MSEHMRPFKSSEDQEEFSQELDALLARWIPRLAPPPDEMDMVMDGLDLNQPMVIDGWVLCFSQVNMDNWMRVAYIKRDNQGLFQTRGMADALHDWAVGLMD